ncbi:aminoglycoside phosphotransferase family protein [Pelagerythrobacter marinus]|uniref:aminoglycoside phosphotransferase family protein n=1 Tax=Pelagerythrobacter marinus TaxID=538382 RepID=UPI0020372242|nr:phosphotransferase [Pelagerythrobacter marinus]USA40313.1 phosphotransferase [Pelagerythrobacter marinus]WPZ05563.1 phosphotransferase [Pelagerythrobacter marinus]
MNALPDGLIPFLDNAGWQGATVEPLEGDASFRRYFRVRHGDRRAMLMHAPPPHEDPRPFLDVAHWLSANGQRAPEVHAEDAAAGWVLLEDFGTDRMRDWLEAHPDGEANAYACAIDALVALHRLPPGPFAPYDLAAYRRELALFTDWYCPAMGLAVDREGYLAAWDEVMAPVLDRQRPGVTVLRDYHAENIMLLDPAPDGSGPQGLIDFQDALVGHPAYDLVSLLQDARRDVAPELERAMIERYVAAAGPGDGFAADYARLGAQRNAKIVGIFTRLWKRDGKARYLAMIPRVWEALERDLADPALAPVARWFDDNIPRNIRDTFGGELM